MKTCSDCRAELPVTEFPRNCAKRDGRLDFCRRCQAMHLAASVFRKFRCEAHFWELVESMPVRRKEAAA